jgi:nucleotide-binding universal stress UspA family protein
MIELRTLLVATDLGPDSVPAFGHARFLAEQFGARLILYHGVSVPEHRYPHWAFAHGHEVWISAERHARAELERQAQVLSFPHELVVERRSSPLEGLAHLMLGSVAEEVMQRSFCPILCVPPSAIEAPAPYRRLLVPTDFSEVSRAAFPMAAFLARRFEADVVALHVVHAARSGTLEPLPANLGAGTEETLREFFRAHFQGLNVVPSVRRGHVWQRIAHAAESLRNGLVVMSTRGHDSFSDRILGSNTERVLRHAPCPVLVA